MRSGLSSSHSEKSRRRNICMESDSEIGSLDLSIPALSLLICSMGVSAGVSMRSGGMSFELEPDVAKLGRGPSVQRLSGAGVMPSCSDKRGET